MFLEKLSERLLGDGWDIECFHSPLYPGELEAVFVPRCKAAVMAEELCPVPEEARGAVEYIPLREHLAAENAEDASCGEKILRLKAELEEAYSRAFRAFADALDIHDEWESYYIRNMDKGKADAIAREMAARILGSDEGNKKRAVIRHLFFGAATPDGALDHIPNLTAGLNSRIFIKGRAGSGKSTLLKHLAAEAEKKGYDTDVFHCGFDPGSVDMLIFPELGTAIFDSTLPHEYFPERAGDEILDLYELLIVPGTDERYKEELAEVKSRYTAKMKEATASLAAARDVDSAIRQLMPSGLSASWTEEDEEACRMLAARIRLR
jgi:hypothetical protein